VNELLDCAREGFRVIDPDDPRATGKSDDLGSGDESRHVGSFLVLWIWSLIRIQDQGRHLDGRKYVANIGLEVDPLERLSRCRCAGIASGLGEPPQEVGVAARGSAVPLAKAARTNSEECASTLRISS
jgi:hypothetical protein